jgi:hypothetical protein
VAQSQTSGRAISRPVFLVSHRVRAPQLLRIGFGSYWICTIASDECVPLFRAGVLWGAGLVGRETIPVGGEGEWWERWGHV